ncbi:hypothetical protein ACH40D_32135 [Streptomyces olivaceoviridis]|uniref:Uncharacterized protein n=2 Tax=Streptomyces olivaceoviridis TaxID=1921 RepID=A0ABW7VE98_STROI|nr:hypothetical protein [Streptomyces corchorusii]
MVVIALLLPVLAAAHPGSRDALVGGPSAVLPHARVLLQAAAALTIPRTPTPKRSCARR